ncbi:rRNA-processing protein RRP15, partial [Ascoidea rubescens DSM 1968]
FSDSEDSNGSDASKDFEESDDEIPIQKQKTKKRNRGDDDGSKDFSNAITNILNSKLKSYDRKDPMLVRAKKSLKKFEEDKLESKAKRLLSIEKKSLMDQNRIRHILPSAGDTNIREYFERERAFKKVAQRGVIKLFNAILSTQTQTNTSVSNNLEKQKKKGFSINAQKKEELLNDISKSKFLDLVKAAG